MLPPYRTGLYSEFRACERFGLVPPGILSDWDENPPEVQLLMLAYNDIRCQEEMDMIPMPIRFG